jgi:hypothetical protein
MECSNVESVQQKQILVALQQLTIFAGEADAAPTLQ